MAVIPLVTFSQAGRGNLNQYTYATFKRITTDEGLSQNLVSAIAQDTLGLIWIGTKDGLNRYNGYEFHTYQFDPGSPFSLADNYITSLYVDPSGRLWVGTFAGGLHLFDHKTERFIRLMHDPEDNGSISHNHIQAMVSDKWGNLWVGTNGGGLNMLKLPEGEKILNASQVEVKRFGPNEGFPENDDRVKSLYADRSGLIWIGTTRNVMVHDPDNDLNDFQLVLFKGNQSSKAIKEFADTTSSAGSVFHEDSNGLLWVGNTDGLHSLDRENMIFVPYDAGAPGFSADLLITMVPFENQDREEFWISTENGITILEPSSGKYVNLPFSNESIPGLLQTPQGRVISLFSDMAGTLWIGSNGHGLSLFDPMTMTFNYPNDGFFNPQGKWFSVRNLSIRSFFETQEPEKVLWIGANEGFYIVYRATSSLKKIPLKAHSSREESSVFSLQGDNEGNIWLATGHGLVKYDPSTSNQIIFSTGLSEPGGNKDPRASYVHVDKDQVWILTPNTIARFNKEKLTFEHYRYNNDPVDEYKESVFPVLHQDTDGNFWIAAKNGLHHFNVSNRQMISYSHDPDSRSSLIMNHVLCLLPDPEQPERYLWVGTAGGGFSQFDIQDKTFKNYSSKNGLANDMVYGIMADDNNNLWISTNRGLSKFNITEESFSNYTISDGLQSNEFNAGAYYKNPDGELFFGGIRGYNCFLPSQIKSKDFQPLVVFTSLRLLKGDKNLAPEISSPGALGSGPINLKHGQNHFTVEFSAMDLYSAPNNKYAYSMSKAGDHWIPLGNSHSVTFTGLKHGVYNLKVRGTNNNGIWSNNQAILQIRIRPPWWRHPVANLFYVFMIIIAFLGIREFEISRMRMRNQMEISRIEADKLKELDHLKSQFFANISHELRTPLTLIKGPIEQMLDEQPGAKKKRQLAVMHANTNRLMQLINQLLDLSRLESGDYFLRVSKANSILSVLKNTVMNFSSLAEEKNITLKFLQEASEDDIKNLGDCYFDQDIIEKIMYNILSNAFKFTPSHGRIIVSVCVLPNHGESGELEIGIEDNGIGIPDDKLPFIYDRFFQVDASSTKIHEGTGIGLAYVKELARVHKISIALESRINKGTKFCLRLPIGKNHYKPEQIIETAPYSAIPDQSTAGVIKELLIKREGKNSIYNGKPRVLVVEDHADVRNYLKESLLLHYHIMEAANANEGLNMAKELIPDLILSDVMMPGMDGFEFCEKIKTNEKTSHVPVILVTARAGEQDRIHGLENGADDYITKPFNPRELKARVKNLIENRKTLREKFSNQVVVHPGEISVTSRDSIFMEKLLKVVENNIHNESFGVKELAKETGMSQSQLHRKLKAVINQSANHFIRSIRMHRAMELLQQDAGNVADIAFMVGFSDPGYFTKTFKTFFGSLPSEVKGKAK